MPAMLLQMIGRDQLGAHQRLLAGVLWRHANAHNTEDQFT